MARSPLKSPPTLITPPTQLDLYSIQQSLKQINQQLLDSWMSIVQPLELTLTHGVELRMENPLPGKRPVKAVWASGENSVTFRNIDANGNTYLGESPCPYVGFTAKLAPPPGSAALALSTPVGPSIASGAGVFVPWDVQRYVPTGNFSHSVSVNNDRIYCLAPGKVCCEYGIAFTARTPAAGDGVGCYVIKNGNQTGTGTRFGDQRTGAQLSGCDTLSCSPGIDVVAGDYVQIIARQSNAASAARTLQGNSSQECSVQLRYVEAAAPYSATVILNLW